MKALILVLCTILSAAAFAIPSAEQKCYQAMDHSAKTSKPTVVMANSGPAWNFLLEDVIKKARLECKEGAKFGECLGGFLDDLRACDNVGDKKLQIYIEEVRRAAEPHATHSGKPVEVSAEQGTANK
jgi:hypothetical protein